MNNWQLKIGGLIAGILLSGCTPMAEQVMPPLQYKQPINMHIAKTAYLNWEIGKQYAASQPTFISANSDPIAAILTTAIDNEERHRNPGRYTLVYGKAQQAVFMTSLQHILAENSVFKRVELTTEAPKLDKNAVLMTVNFKRTRVSDADENFKIILDVELTIQSQQKPMFTRTYLVESDPSSGFFTKNFKDQQTDVSQKLLGKIINGIGAWKGSL